MQVHIRSTLTWKQCKNRSDVQEIHNNYGCMTGLDALEKVRKNILSRIKTWCQILWLLRVYFFAKQGIELYIWIVST